MRPRPSYSHVREAVAEVLGRARVSVFTRPRPSRTSVRFRSVVPAESSSKTSTVVAFEENAMRFRAFRLVVVAGFSRLSRPNESYSNSVFRPSFSVMPPAPTVLAARRALTSPVLASTSVSSMKCESGSPFPSRKNERRLAPAEYVWSTR